MTENTARILVVKDCPADADSLRTLLPSNGPVCFHIESVTRLSEVAPFLEQHPVDLILLDLDLPDSAGLSALHHLRQATPDIPVIVWAGTDDPELAVAAVRDGAQDFLVAGQCNASLLTRAVRHALERGVIETALRTALRDKEVLLKEHRHRMKNNLQILSSLLFLQASHSDDPNVKALLQVTQNRVLSMALIHNHLHRSSNPEAVDMADYIRSLCEQLYHLLATTPETLQLHLDLAPLQLATEQAVPCGMLANELVSNALKHAFPEGRGELRVTLQPAADGRMVRLCVADNGVGLPPGFSLEDDASMGLQVASGLARQLGGTLEIGTGTGTRFEIVFPLGHP